MFRSVTSVGNFHLTVSRAQCASLLLAKQLAHPLAWQNFWPEPNVVCALYAKMRALF